MAPHRHSKRETLKHKYKVQRKVAEHNRRMRRLARKQRQEGIIKGQRKAQRELGVPNLYPYKKQLLEQAARRLALRSTVTAEAGSLGESPVSAPALSGANALEKTPVFREVARSRRSFAAALRRVVEFSDVVVEVLDARNPLESRSSALELLVRHEGARAAGGKRLILVLSKADLVPREALQAWLCRLRAEYPTLAMHEGLDQTGQHRGPRQPGSAVQPKQLSQLVQLLKLYAKRRADKQSSSSTITVGIVGKPNVGKSSLLNALCREQGAVATGARPGITKTLQEVRLDSNIRLLDSPGVVLDDVQEIDPAPVVEVEQTKAAGSPSLLYEMPAFSMCDMVAANEATREESFATQFLALLAKRRGLLRKAGVLDLEAAARVLVQDWATGRIPYYTWPKHVGLPSSQQLGAQIVSNWDNAFDLDVCEPSPSAEEVVMDENPATDAAPLSVADVDDEVVFHVWKHKTRRERQAFALPLSPGAAVENVAADADLEDFEFSTSS
jgi:nuclear GTP-binding protein